MIDDGSNDGTSAILDQLTASRKDARLIRQENRGRGRRCEQESLTSPATLRSSRTPTSDTTQPKCRP